MPAMSLEADSLRAFEEHSPEGVRAALAAGAGATDPIQGCLPIDWLIEGYLRSTRFSTCLRILMDAGATIPDPLLRSLLLDDEAGLRGVLADSSAGVHRKLHVRCAFTSCDGVTPLHVCAEFNSVRCARLLLEAGADVDAKADVDADGFGGQTAVFHAVNSIHNHGRPMLELLVAAGCDLNLRLKGLVWGGGYEWETLVLDVTPLSYAQCGLYAQFHRREQDVYSNLAFLYAKRYGANLRVKNVPNAYLKPRS